MPLFKDTVCDCFVELRHNGLLRELLHMVLAAGNFLNAVSCISRVLDVSSIYSWQFFPLRASTVA